MTTTIRRAGAVAAAAALMSTLGALTTFDAASAVSVTRSYDQIIVIMDANETADVALRAFNASSPMCTTVINQSIALGRRLSDWAAQQCPGALSVCADRVAYGASAGVKFLATTYECLDASSASAPGSAPA